MKKLHKFRRLRRSQGTKRVVFSVVSFVKGVFKGVFGKKGLFVRLFQLPGDLDEEFRKLQAGGEEVRPKGVKEGIGLKGLATLFPEAEDEGIDPEEEKRANLERLREIDLLAFVAASRTPDVRLPEDVAERLLDKGFNGIFGSGGMTPILYPSLFRREDDNEDHGVATQLSPRGSFPGLFSRR